jgi:aminopeptidase-like protein
MTTIGAASPFRAPETAGQEAYALIERLYPICRSITGDGVRQSLKILQEWTALDIQEVPSGTQVFDWTVPKEWNIRDAWVKSPDGEKVVDFKRSNISVVNYSMPIHERLSLEQLKPHLFSLPEQPDWIPYRTSYYHETWGFCLTHNQLSCLPDGEYEVFIDSDLAPGHLTYGEAFIPGRSENEILVSTHACHPALCNDGLSGVAICTLLARHLRDVPLDHSIRFLFIPGTIGSITWLALNEPRVARIKHGLTASCVGDRGHPTYKRSRRGDAEVDRVVELVLRHHGTDYQIKDFVPFGYDERQFCSPGFDLPVGALSRTPHGRYPEYHTSADDLSLVDPDSLRDSLELFLAVLFALDENRRYQNTNPKCEPQLGRRGLYSSFGGRRDSKAIEMAMLWVLNLSDGNHSLLDIGERSGMAFESLYEATTLLLEHGLLEPST